MNFFVASVIGLIQGLTEFLPVSSSGHLVLFYQIFNIKNNTIFLSILLHLATLFSIIVVYRKQIIELIKHPFCKTNKLLVISTIPTVIMVLIFKPFIESSFSGNYLIYGFLITAVLLGVSEYLSTSSKYLSKISIINTKDVQLSTITPKLAVADIGSNNAEFSNDNAKDNTALTLGDANKVTNETHIVSEDICNINLNYKQAFIMGIGQGCATLPAISRSGTTIATGLLVGAKKEDVTTYSFLMSIPIILASMFYELLSIDSSSFVGLSFFNLFTSCLVAFVAGVFSIKFMINIVKKQSLSNFSFYLIGLSFLILLFKYII